MLAIGVGSGRYAVPLARRLGRDGLVAAVDLHADMLRLTRRRAARHAVRAMVTVAADASMLPFSDATFDAAWLVSTLGQVPDPTMALMEAGRVVRPGGRVVVRRRRHPRVRAGRSVRCADRPEGVAHLTAQRRRSRS